MSERRLAARAAAGLPLAAAPVFAVLAVVTSGDAADMLCMHGGSPLGGMTLMYALMAVFHVGPWLRLLSRSTQSTVGKLSQNGR